MPAWAPGVWAVDAWFGTSWSGDSALGLDPAAITSSGGVGAPSLLLDDTLHPSAITSSGAVGSPSLIRSTGPLSVDVTASLGALENASESQVLAGENHAKVGNEIISFETADLTAPYNYDLSDLTRELRSTDGTGHQIGDLFCLITDAVQRIAVGDELEGETILVRCVSKFQDPGDVTPVEVIISTKDPADVFVPDDIFVEIDPTETIYDTLDLTTGVTGTWSDWIALDFSSAIPAGIKAVLVEVRMSGKLTDGDDPIYFGIEYRKADGYPVWKLSELLGQSIEGINLTHQAILTVTGGLTGEFRYTENADAEVYRYVIKAIAYFKKP